MIEVTFINDYKYSTSSPVYQWDYGQKLIMYGLDTTNEVIQVHFTDNSCERTIVRLASKYADYYQVSIPDGLLENCFPINAYIYLITDDSGYTTHLISIPVIARKKPEGFTSHDDPVIRTQVEQLILDINEANKELIDAANALHSYVDKETEDLQNQIDDVTVNISDVSYRVDETENDIYDIKSDISDIKDKLTTVNNPKKLVSGLYSITLLYDDVEDEQGNYHYENEVISIDNINNSAVGRLVEYTSSLQAFSLINRSSYYSISSVKLIMKY